MYGFWGMPYVFEAKGGGGGGGGVSCALGSEEVEVRLTTMSAREMV